MGTDLQRIVLAFAARESLTINKTLEIERDEAAGLYSRAFLSLDHVRLTIQHARKLLLYIIIRYSADLLPDLQALVLTELELRLFPLR